MRDKTRIRKFILEEILPDRVVVGDPLAEGLLDSLDIERLVAYLEDTYQITVNDDDLTAENLDSLDSLMELLRQKQQPAS